MYLIHDQYLLLLTMVGVGIAWASILSMPYAILSGALPAARMGVYMGVFNFFIVIPEIVAALGFGRLIRAALRRRQPERAAVHGDARRRASCCWPPRCVARVRRRGRPRRTSDAVIDADEHEPLTVQESVQPVPSNALLDEEERRRD